MVEEFVSWCELSLLQLNMSKIKEMFIDFRMRPASFAPTIIKGEPVTAAQQYKYLGSILDDNFDANTDFINKKANQRLFFLRKLRCFNVSVESVLYFFECVSFNSCYDLLVKNCECVP